MNKASIKETASHSIDFNELRRYRLSRIQAQLQENDFGAALLFEPQNIRYATDISNANLIWTFYTPVRYAFVPATGLPILFEYGLDTCPLSADDYAFVGDIRPSISLATFYRLNAKDEWIGKWCDQMMGLLAELCGGSQRLAVDSLVPTACLALANRGIQVFDGDGLMARARLIKCADEIKCLQAAVDVADLGARRIREKIRPGVTEQQLWSVLHQTNIEQGGEWIETQLLSSGQRTNPWYQTASEKVIEDGDLVVFDTDMVGPFGYVGDISRAYLCGDRPNADQREAYRVAYDTLQHNIEVFRPGISFRELAEQCFLIPEPYRDHQEAIGHGAGVQIEFPLLCQRDEIERMPYPEMLLQPGMVICAEAYAGKAGGTVGVKLEEQLVITSDGCELLSRTPFDERCLA
ncbi:MULTISPECIES: Xaa-Pro peptidase family protein [unclassified Mesorhizobium]|uniref:M24 family metallopeptidase n=1 Tax=unclassified Mesorhizobium TaxID=325217 RepID=UPI00067E761E|nr:MULTISPECIES: Xaa-Pro peptidase family protein [unclassified Mesorhizobium]WJI67479.1 Xaa-Pro peptidase family protein [Mesorhizobium sp. C399B]